MPSTTPDLITVTAGPVSTGAGGGGGGSTDASTGGGSGAAVGAAKVRFKPEGARFLAGESKPVELQIELPEDLQEGRLYKATIRLRNARLLLEMECIGRSKAPPRRQK